MAELTEKSIGNKAAKMVESRLMSEISSSGLPYENNNNYSGRGRFPLSQTQGIAKFRKEALTSIAIAASKHLFVHHYGADIKRKSNATKSSKGKMFIRKTHPFKLKSRNMIDEAVFGSGAIEFLASELPKVKSDVVLEVFKKGLPNGKKEG